MQSELIPEFRAGVGERVLISSRNAHGNLEARLWMDWIGYQMDYDLMV